MTITFTITVKTDQDPTADEVVEMVQLARAFTDSMGKFGDAVMAFSNDKWSSPEQ